MGTERVRSYTYQRECHNWYHCDLSQSQVCIPGHPTTPLNRLRLNNEPIKMYTIGVIHFNMIFYFDEIQNKSINFDPF